MKAQLKFFGLILVGLIASSCADEKADLEKARYLLGSGTAADATEALSILTPMLTSSSGAEKVEVYRLYAGAKMQSVGFSGIEILPAIQYPTKTGGTIQTAQMFKDIVSSVSSNSTTATALTDAIAKLVSIQTDGSFSAATARERNGIRFQLGLAYFFDAIRIVVIKSGYKTATVAADLTTGSACEKALEETNTPTGTVDTGAGTQLTAADVAFGTTASGAGLDAQNAIRKSASDLNSAIGNAQSGTLCTYLATLLP